MSGSSPAEQSLSAAVAVPQTRRISASAWAVAGVLAILLLAGLAAYGVDKAYLLTSLARIVVFAVGAVALNLILGFGGMVSFGHALYVGIGVYAVGILDHYGVTNGWLHLLAAFGASAVIGLIVGSLSLRVSGLYFIMITLAFSQMFYYVFTGLSTFGGDEGMTLSGRSQFGFSLKGALPFYLFCLVVLALVSGIVYRLVNSRFGMVIQGARINEKRMLALGYPVFLYRLVAYVISGILCSLSGVLLANLNEFASSQYMHWIVSGDLIIMIIIGGFASVAGPIIGSIAFIALQDILSAYTDSWQVVMGPILVVLVIFAREGLVGLIAKARTRRG